MCPKQQDLKGQFNSIFDSFMMDINFRVYIVSFMKRKLLGILLGGLVSGKITWFPENVAQFPENITWFANM